MTITVKEIDAKLRKALKIADRDRKIAFIMSLGQYILMDLQMEAAEKGRPLELPEPPAKP